MRFVHARCREYQENWRFQNAERRKEARDNRRAKFHCNRCHKSMSDGRYKLCEDCRGYMREKRRGRSRENA